MLETIITYIMSKWVEWLFICLSGLTAWSYRKFEKRQKAKEAEDNAIKMGMQALLRNDIINVYNKSEERGYCPIYQKQALRNSYSAYHDLGGNDVATDLYKKTLEMPTEPHEETA